MSRQLEQLTKCQRQGNRFLFLTPDKPGWTIVVLMGLMTLLLSIFATAGFAQTREVGPGACDAFPLLPQMYSYSHSNTGWMGIATVGETGQNVFIEARDGDPGELVHISQLPSQTGYPPETETNFLVYNWTGGGDTGYFRTLTDEGPYNIQHIVAYDPGQGSVIFDHEYSFNYGSSGFDCSLIHVWDADLVAGNTYKLNLDSDAEQGHLEIRAALLRTGEVNGWIARTDALWDEPAREDPDNEGYSFTVPTTGSYALVVFRNGYHNRDVLDSDYHFTLEDLGGSTDLPELTVHSIFPNIAPADEVFNLEMQFRNSGTVASDPCIARVWVDDIPTCLSVYVPGILAQQTILVDTCELGPFGAGINQIEVAVEVDFGDNIDEYDDDNNTATTTMFVAHPRPNLIVSSISPFHAVPHNPVNMEIVVSNIGIADADPSFTSFYVAGNDICSQLPTPALLPGESTTVICNLGYMPGTHSIGATADVTNVVDEGEAWELGNSRNTTINCTGPDLTILEFTPLEIANTDPIEFEFLVRNNGNADSPVCYAEITNNGVSLTGLFTIGSVPDGEEIWFTSPLVDPLPAGTSQITICVDPNDDVDEYYNDNNCIEGDVESLVYLATVFPDGHGEFPTIQDAVDALAPGGTVHLAYGTFTGPGNRDITFSGKDVTIYGTDRYNPGRCIIDCQGSSADPHRAFVFADGQTNDARLMNFTIKNGWMDDDGGAVLIDGANPTFQTMIFRDNVSSYSHGGAIRSNSSFISNDCLFDNNEAIGVFPTQNACGGAVYCSGSDYEISMERNTFVNNQANLAGAMWLSTPPQTPGTAVINNCLFVGNSSQQGTVNSSGLIVPDLNCCDVWGNTGGDWVEGIAGQNNSDGNISADPLFCDFAGGDYGLHEDSPCAEENSGACGQIGALGVGCAPSGQSVYSVLADGSGDYATIQEAFDSAHTGDVIELTDGEFIGPGNRNLHFGGKDLIIRSQSGNAEDCIIDCGWLQGESNRAFQFIDSGESSAAAVENITIKWGHNPQGGAVYIQGASPTFRGCIFSHNYGTDQGGAIFAQNSYSTFFSCVFHMNNANNEGAGLYLSDGSYRLENCTISANSAQSSGGGIHLVNCEESTITECVFAGNSADVEGGALLLDVAQVYLTQCTINENISEGGSGISCNASSMVSMTGTNITSGYNSEAVFCEAGTYFNITCSNIWGNQGGDWVGHIASEAGADGNLSVDPLYCNVGMFDYHLNLDSPVNADNNACGQVGPFGIGCGIQTYVLFADGSGDFPSIQDAINASSWGDTISLANGIYTGDGNRDLVFDGKAITLKSQSGIPASCIIDCNGSSGEYHRAFRFTAADGPNGRITGITIRNGWKPNGGAIQYSGGSVALDNCIIEASHSTGGGAIGIFSGALPAISNCVFRANTASDAGGAITTVSGAHPAFNNCQFTGNTADYGGGVLYVHGPSAPTFENCLFNNNEANHGGGVYFTSNEGGIAEFTSCTFFGNQSTNGAVGYGRDSSHADISNSILSDSPAGQAITCVSDATVAATCSNVWGNAGGDWVGGITGQDGSNGNFSLEPEYCDAGAEVFTLASGSPCLPGGNDCEVLIGAYDVGCSGGPRILQVQADGSGDYATIQAAVDASYHGDTVQLADGIYTGTGNHSVNLDGKQITICSESGNAMDCIINCEGSESSTRRAFQINSNEGPDTVIEKLTIANGWMANGGGIQINNANPIIAGCRFTSNNASNGGGIFVGGASTPYINECFFEGNSVTNGGAGIIVMGTGAVVENCHFRYNFAHNGGGGIYVYQTTASIAGCLFENNSCTSYGSDLEINTPGKVVTVEGCTFVGGNAPGGTNGAVRVRGASTPEFSYCLLAFSQQGGAISCDGDSEITISCSDIFGNPGGDWVGCLSGFNGIDGNFSSDPQFCEVESSDYQLMDTSPCLPAGNDCGQLIGVFGQACVSAPVAVRELPTVVSLTQNYPNPFNPSTTIEFSLPRSSQTSLRIYNVQGRLVKTLLQETLDSGYHKAIWRGRDNRGCPVASGVYWYMLQSDDKTETRKMLLLK